MASDLHFLITNCPGPFRLIMGWGHMLEKHGNHLEIELTLKPIEAGVQLLGHDYKFKIPFEVALMGVTTKYGHGSTEPRNVRMLGRFIPTGDLQTSKWRPESGRYTSYIDPQNAAPELHKWQWEVVFNPESRSGFSGGAVAKLLEPLLKDWTL